MTRAAILWELIRHSPVTRIAIGIASIVLIVWQATLVLDLLHNLTVFLAQPVTPTVSRLELAWFLGGTAALRFNISGYLLRRRILSRAQDMHAAARNVMLARARKENELTMLAVQITFWLLGVLAVLTPEPSPQPSSQSDTLVGLLAPPGLLAVQWLLAIGSYRQRRYDRLIGTLPVPRRSLAADET